MIRRAIHAVAQLSNPLDDGPGLAFWAGQADGDVGFAVDQAQVASVGHQSDAQVRVGPEYIEQFRNQDCGS